jgi:hypothetical protein
MLATLRTPVIPTPANLKMLATLRTPVIPTPANLKMLVILEMANLKTPDEPLCFVFEKVGLIFRESST